MAVNFPGSSGMPQQGTGLNQPSTLPGSANTGISGGDISAPGLNRAIDNPLPTGGGGSGWGGSPAQSAAVPGANPRAFNSFMRHVSPNPLPTKTEFYWNELKDNYRHSKRKGGQKYKEKLRKDQHTRLKFLALTSIATMGFTFFRRLRRTFSTALMLCLIGYPVMEANKTFPRLAEAYEQVKQGNPSQGKQTFREALDASVYSIYLDFLKPLAMAGTFTMLLSIPAAIRGEGAGFMQRVIIRGGARKLHINPNWKLIRGVHNLVRKITVPGDRISNWIREHITPIRFIERG